MVRLYISKTERNHMVVIDLGWQKVIMPRESALKMVELLEKSEVYEDKYWSRDEREKKGITEEYTHHVYPNDKHYNMKIITDELYQMAKLAGKPEKG
jgi:hypothetical protein